MKLVFFAELTNAYALLYFDAHVSSGPPYTAS